MAKKILFGIIFISLMTSSAMAGATDILEKNKRLVRGFYDLAFNQHRPREAASKYLASDYKQHNPSAADGKKDLLMLLRLSL